MTYFIFDRLYIFQLHHITNENNTKLPEKHWVSFSALPLLLPNFQTYIMNLYSYYPLFITLQINLKETE